MAKLVTNAISDTLIIKACNTEAGSGGVARWLSGVSRRVKEECEAKAPVSDPADRMHRPWDPGGTYKASFVRGPKIGNQHRIQRTVTNTSDHAIFVERGRSSSRADQYFSSKRSGGEPHWSDYTGGREGKHIMEDALETVLRTSRAYHAHAVVIRP